MRERKKRSLIWKIPKEDLEKIVVEGKSFSDIMRKLGLQIGSCHFRTLKKRMDYDKINYSHIPQGCDCNKNRKFPKREIPLEKIMVVNSTYNTKHLKNRLLKNSTFKNECSICGQSHEWNGKKLVMVMDHINGVRDDHRIENLRLLCPNCNSQQDTFCGKKSKTKHHYCKECGKEKKYRKGDLCPTCSSKKNGFNHRVVKERPSKEQLLQEVEESNFCAVGRKYGVSDNAIRKWLGIR